MSDESTLDYLIADVEHGEGCRDCFVGEPHACPRMMSAVVPVSGASTEGSDQR